MEINLCSKRFFTISAVAGEWNCFASIFCRPREDGSIPDCVKNSTFQGVKKAESYLFLSRPGSPFLSLYRLWWRWIWMSSGSSSSVGVMLLLLWNSKQTFMQQKCPYVLHWHELPLAPLHCDRLCCLWILSRRYSYSYCHNMCRTFPVTFGTRISIALDSYWLYYPLARPSPSTLLFSRYKWHNKHAIIIYIM